ncbi:hypothetical protein NE236_00030 [Actinoallomurus purpureus]|uniref:hypothetical protein n=1 Tax=Actinoallomurus purpureus TaxID=478114 RepID=UPI002093B238|nr:hypothetical protein [Actinoallomurus purpureus]MCO6003364.1 hypothetical protein [Actinoallomurus purpureus]
MSFMERSNWQDPNHPRRFRLFIPLAVALVLAVGAVVALTTKVGLTAFGGAPNCASASATPTARTPRTGAGRRRIPQKGAEEVKVGATPAASPTDSPSGGASAAPSTGTGTADPGGAPPSGAASADPGTAAPSPAGRGARPLAAAPAAAPSTGSAMPDASAAPSAGTAMPDAGAAPSTGTAMPDTGAMPSASGSAGTAMPAPSTSAGSGSAAPATRNRGSATPSSCPTPTGGAAAADPNANCTLIVPANPLSARGLATPYRLTATDAAMGPCNEANVNQSAFVQATIIDRATGKLSVYDPLVIDQGTQPAAAPVTPALPAGAVVGIWFGYNGDNLTLRGAGGALQQGRCVGGLNGSVFGQFAYCNASAFFTAANAAIRAGRLTVPALGTAKDGMPCMSTRDFALIDQDQSDNVTTTYLATGNGRTAQNTAANKGRLAGAQTLANPSDNALLDVFVDPALGCTPWTAPDLANPGTVATSLALDELQAAAHQKAPSALVPLNNPMTMVNDQMSTAKTNLYRAGVDQAALPAGQTPAVYCRTMDTVQAARLQKNMQLLAGQASPMPAAANSLFTFLGMRLQQSFGNLNCQNFGLTNPVAKLTMNGDVVTAVTFAGNGNQGGNGGNGNGGGKGGKGGGRHHGPGPQN